MLTILNVIHRMINGSVSTYVLANAPCAYWLEGRVNRIVYALWARLLRSVLTKKRGTRQIRLCVSCLLLRIVRMKERPCHSSFPANRARRTIMLILTKLHHVCTICCLLQRKNMFRMVRRLISTSFHSTFLLFSSGNSSPLGFSSE